ncbi:hypothetical protein B0H10DRAFT_1951346 [Mycena sp. CBHHK59/15]|nr:hypothetical protein B0H10DRAFT_1951346 [Mycena sp. CBHHK59/15]
MPQSEPGHSRSIAGVGPLIVHLPPVTPLYIPRRATLCTDDGRDAPAFHPADLGRTRAASSSWAARGPPMRIDVGQEQRRIRPLPRIPVPLAPGPRSAPPEPRHQRSLSSLRPLPRLPVSGVSISVTPASPLSPLMSLPASNTHLSAPAARPPVPRFVSLSLQTSPDALLPRIVEPPPSLPAPAPAPAPAPSIPEPPSLMLEPPPPSPGTTTRRRRISKLRRHLGESIHLELFPDSLAGDTKIDIGGGVLAETRQMREREEEIYSHTAVAVKKLLDLSEESDASSDDDEEDDGDSREEWELTHGQAAQRGVPVQRLSRNWVRERGKERWVEGDYAKILRELRAL